MPLNSRLFHLAVLRKVDPILVKQARELMDFEFESKKEQALKEFEASPITKELDAGPSAFSSIPALTEVGGNLFSFLGFNRGEQPARELRDYLDENITIDPHRGRGKVVGNKLVYTAKVKFPTLDEVDQAMAREVPLDWDQRAFTNRIAKGAPGLPNYLFQENPPLGTPEPSRSSTAIQIKSTLRGGSFRGVPYVSKVLDTVKRLFAQKRTRG